MTPELLYKKAKSRIKRSITDVGTYMNIINTTIKHPPLVQRIVCYHGVDLYGNTKFNSRFISERSLDDQFRFFKEKCHVVSVKDFFANDFHTTKPTIAITFDDGYRNNLYKVLPLLEKYQISATFYITAIRHAGIDMHWPDCLDLATVLSNKPFNINGEVFKVRKGAYVSEQSGKKLKEVAKDYDFEYKKQLMDCIPGGKHISQFPELAEYWNLLEIEEIRTLARSEFVTIGSHGYYHNCLERIQIENAINELKVSKQFLEDIIDKEVNDLAYPDGSYSRQLVKAAFEMGYYRQVSVDSFMPSDPEDYILKKRMVNNPHISVPNQMLCFLKGTYY